MSRLVAHRGFEPLISALRGRCPGPLDECATPTAGYSALVAIQQTKYIRTGIVCKPAPGSGQGNRNIVAVILSEGEESRETLNNVIPVKTGISTRSWRSASGGRLRGNDGLSPNHNAIALAPGSLPAWGFFQLFTLSSNLHVWHRKGACVILHQLRFY